jgi:hypothetical protein
MYTKIGREVFLSLIKSDKINNVDVLAGINLFKFDSNKRRNIELSF